jgi:hypothetical protein
LQGEVIMKKLALAAVALSVIVPSNHAAATTLKDSADAIAAIVAASGIAPTPPVIVTEAAAVAAIGVSEAAESIFASITIVGQDYDNGIANADIYSYPNLTNTLTFAYVNPATNSTTTGPPTTSVSYYEWTGGPIAFTPSGSVDLSSGWTLLGTSSAVDFSFSTTLTPIEAVILSVPIGAGGPIVIPGVGGYNVAEDFVVAFRTTPLPAALPLFVTGLGALGLLGWRRKRKAAALPV